ncbi:histidine phosphatase family protein [Desulfovibrio sp. ZJ200]|uniref:histidine phosphatase family protein n=1 Tax=Desulfovibrio sp. ZJ200 TaxID=2709792 RepID=UPI0013E9E09D|nr:histidine phosphatase family protein [Desulfovibrio sp. ZJ200]
MKKIYLLRHGEAEANVLGLVNGTPAHALTEKGRQQAVRAGRLIKEYGLRFDALMVSHWARARQTAEIVLPGATFETDPRLGEHDSGECGNLTWAEAEKMYPDFFRIRSFSTPYPGGESVSQLHARVLDWFMEADTALAKDASLLAVTHAGPIDRLLRHVCHVPAELNKAVFFAANASLTCIAKEPGNRWSGDPGGWELKFFSLL